MKRLFALTLLLMGLWLMPVYSVSYAQEDTPAETESNDATGAGMAILLFGIFAILVVGAASTARRSQKSS
jgi:cell division protein FtsW (lipid II flippase)